MCKEGFYKNFNGICIECPPNSVYSEIDGKCLCKKGYKLSVSGSCTVNCPFTMVLNLAGDCVCPEGLALSYAGICIPCTSAQSYVKNGYCSFCPGRLQYNKNTNRCGCGFN